MILDGVLNEGDPLPSVRTVAAEYRVNPLTVLKAYQQLVDEQLVESSAAAACSSTPARAICCCRASARSFSREQWPRIHATIQRLGLTPEELLDAEPRKPRRSAEAMAVHRSTRPPQGLRQRPSRSTASTSASKRAASSASSAPTAPARAPRSTRSSASPPIEGELKVLGRDPWTERDQLMRDVSFIADVAVLPRWMRVSQALDYVGRRASALRSREGRGLPGEDHHQAHQQGARAVEGHGDPAPPRAGHGHRRASCWCSTSRRSASTSSTASSSTTRCSTTTSTAAAPSS